LSKAGRDTTIPPTWSMERYSRQIPLKGIGTVGQRKLHDARVAVVGLGGLGSISALQLAGMGVGFLRLVDRDVVELTNLHRQALYDMSSLGYPKVEIAERRLKAINPDLITDPIALTVNSKTAEDIVRGVDIVIDGLDRLEPRYSLNAACLSRKVPYIFGSALESYGSASTIIPGKTACLECMLGRIDDDNMPTCEVVGVFPQILSVIASIQVKEALNLILGQDPVLSNKLLFADIDSMDFQLFHVVRTPNCGACGTFRTMTTHKPSQVVQLCGKGSFSISTNSILSLDLEEVGRVLSTRFEIGMRTGFAVTVAYTDRISAVLMKTGNMLVHGAKDKEEALKVYEDVLGCIGDC